MRVTFGPGEPALVETEEAEPLALAPWQPPCEERLVTLQTADGPRQIAYWVHGYTMADAAAWRTYAAQLAGGRVPDADTLMLAQVCAVCRESPQGHPCFKVPTQGAAEAMRLLRTVLPGQWIEIVCRESDALCLRDYLPPEQARRRREATARLGELLTGGDGELWHALSVLSMKLYGLPLAHNRRPISEVLMHLQHDRAQQARLAEAIGPLAELAGLGG